MGSDIIRLPEQLGPLLRAARQRLGLTQANLAQRLGVSVQAMSRLEKNAGRASFDRIHRLCLLLDLDLQLQTRSATAAPPSTSEW